MILKKIILTKGKPITDDKEVELSTIQDIILAGRGEGGHILMRADQIKYKKEDDRENNQQDSTCGVHT